MITKAVEPPELSTFHRPICRLLMPMQRCAIVTGVFLLCLITGAPAARTALPAEEKEKIRDILEVINQAYRGIQSGELETATEKVRAASDLTIEMMQVDHPDMPEAVKVLKSRLRRVHAMLELTGTRLPPMRFVPMVDADPSVSENADDSDAEMASSKPNMMGGDTMQDQSMSSETMDSTGDASMSRAMNKNISFSLTVAPLLRKHCGGCHVDTGNVRGGLNLNSMALLLDSGSVEPGLGDDSMIVRRMRGMDGNQMPAGGRPPVPASEIQLISTWIDEGAKFDGDDAGRTLAELERTAFVSTATPSEISERRFELAQQQWQIAGINGKPVAIDTSAFHVVGAVPASVVKQVGEAAENHLTMANRLVGGEADESFFPGRATIFVFAKRYDYSEFVQMVQRRQLPSDVRSHWQYTGVNASIAVVVNEDDEPTRVASLLAAPVYSLAMATRGDIPRWIADGVGTAASMRSIRDRDVRRRMTSEVAEAWSAMPSTDAFLDGKMSPQRTEAIGAAVASEMVSPPLRRMFDAMIRSLDAGQDFETAFLTAYNMSVEQFVGRVSGR